MTEIKTIVVPGKSYTDIDGLACVVAYAHLLKLQGKNALAISTGPLNNSVTKTIKSWTLDFKTTVPEDVSEIVVVDISEPKVIENDWGLSKITQLFDHHFGHEHYWQERLGAESHIEPVGACATQIWEEWAKSGHASEIDTISANLLAIAIVSNTLNFNAFVTTDRDRQAFAQLKTHMNLSVNWLEEYYADIEASMLANPAQAIAEDTKVVPFPNLHIEMPIGQLELWNGKKFMDQNHQTIIDTLKPLGEHWLMTIPSISEGKNYLYTESGIVKDLLGQIVDATFVGDAGSTSKLFLRKEILRELQKITPR